MSLVSVNSQRSNHEPLSFDAFVEICNRISELKRQRSLSPLDIACLKAGWEQVSYTEFSEYDDRFTFSSLRSAASRIYQMLAESFGVNSIHKSKLYVFIQDLYRKGKLDRYLLENKAFTNIPITKSILKENNLFVGRAKEIKNLNQLIENNCCICVWGSIGIGKTAFVQEYSKIESNSYDYILFSDIFNISSIQDLSSDILCQVRRNTIDDKPEYLFEFLVTNKCLIILENCNEIECIRDFLNRVFISNSSTKFILVSRTKIDLSRFSYSDSMQLSGLIEFNSLFQKLGLTGQENWKELNQKYSGNISELIKISAIIKDYFNGDVSDYIKSISTVISPFLISEYRKIEFKDIDYKILSELSKTDYMLLSNLLLSLNESYSTSEIINQVSFLENNSFIERHSKNTSVRISPMLKRFLIKEGKFM